MNQPHVCIYPLVFGFPYHWAPQRTESSLLCYLVGPHQLSILTMTGIGIPGFQSFLDWGFYFRLEVKPFPVHACEPLGYSSECLYKEQWGRRASRHLCAIAKDGSGIFLSLFLPLMQSNNFIQQVRIACQLYSQSCARDLGRYQRRSAYGTFAPRVSLDTGKG